LRRRGVIVALVAVVVLAGLAGVIAGRRGHADTSLPLTLSNPGRSEALNYPRGWRPVVNAPSIPGLSLGNAVALAPGGRAGDAGLIMGQLAIGGQGPLPPSLVTRLRAMPRTDIVQLAGNSQAYRYSDLRISGFSGALSLYAVPVGPASSDGLVCYAAPSHVDVMRTCERAAATLVVSSELTSSLIPDPTAAKSIATAISGLDVQRALERSRLAIRTAPGVAAAAASRLARDYASAAKSISAARLRPAVAASSAAALTTALSRTGEAYGALAVAARGASGAGYDRARQQVNGAEAGVAAALASLAEVGYGSPGR
jgi:hypothetical protein